MKLKATMVGGLIKRIEPLYLGSYADCSYMDRPVTLKKVNKNMAVVTDDAFGYGAILGPEWLDDKWIESDGSYKNLPQYDKLYHIKSASSIIHDDGTSLQDTMSNRESVLTAKEVKQEKSLKEKYSKDIDNSIDEITKLAEENLSKCYDGEVIEIKGCTERQSLMLFMKYFAEYSNRQFIKHLSHDLYQLFAKDDNEEVKEYEMKGVEVYIDGDFAARITVDTNGQHKLVHINSNKAGGLELHYEGLEYMSNALYNLLSHNIDTVPDMSVVPAAYSSRIFSIGALCIDQLTRYNENIGEDGYTYVIFAYDSIYAMRIFDDGSMESAAIESDDIMEFSHVDDIVILNEEDSKELLEMIEKTGQ